MEFKTRAEGGRDEGGVGLPNLLFPSAFRHPPSSVSRAFTMIEMMVVVAIVAIITSIIVWNYGDFRSSILTTNMAYEAATSIRQAQFYGVGVRAAETTTGDFDFGGTYGVEFHTGDIFYAIFRDADNDFLCNTGSGCDCGGGSGECVEKVTMLQQVEVVRICAADSGEPTYLYSPTSCGFDTMSINFTRPRPEAMIRAGNNAVDSDTRAAGSITLRGGKHCRIVTIYQAGQVSVSAIPEVDCIVL